jgi:hypothetical protein
MVVKILFGVAEDVTLLAGEDLLGLVAPRSGVVVHLNIKHKLFISGKNKRYIHYMLLFVTSMNRYTKQW